MKRNSILICILFAITANSFIAAKAQAVNTTDSLALVDLYNSTNGPNWYNHTNWLTTKPVGTWYGVTVAANRVTNLKLAINGLSGGIPASIGNMDALTNLNLQSNRLSGTIPSSIGNLQKLSYLNLGYCSLTGAIPAEIGNLTSLDSLLLLYNQLSGAIPAEIGNDVKLTYIQLVDNQLSGAIPAAIGNLVNLTFLNLNINQLSGPIPSSIGNLTNLQNLVMFNNQLSGSIPQEIGNLVNLTGLNLLGNHLSGGIPATIGNLTKLKDLELQNNELSDTIPSAIGNLTNLVGLYLYNNRLSGAIPATIGNFKKIRQLDINHNELSGVIPASLRKLPGSAYVNFSFNRLTQFGEVDSSIDTNYILGNISHNLFTFDGLQVIAKKFPKVTYAPQDTILPVHQQGNVLSVSAGGTLGKNTYTWYKTGDTSKIVIKKDSAFSPAQSGMYYVSVTNKAAKKLMLYSDTVSYTTTLAQTQNSVANVAAVKAITNHFTIYPNPAKDIIHVQVKGNATIILTNSAGKIIFSKNINNDSEINLSTFANRTYYLQNKTTGETQKVIVVH